MKDEDKVAESFEEAMMRIMARMSPAQRLAGMPLEERLADLAPEQRLVGLTEAQAVLALPDAVIRGLSKEYLACGDRRPVNAAVTVISDGKGFTLLRTVRLA